MQRKSPDFELQLKSWKKNEREFDINSNRMEGKNVNKLDKNLFSVGILFFLFGESHV